MYLMASNEAFIFLVRSGFSEYCGEGGRERERERERERYSMMENEIRGREIEQHIHTCTHVHVACAHTHTIKEVNNMQRSTHSNCH